MAAEGRQRRFGVAGFPVEHSRSPAMHEAAYAELGIDASYELLSIAPEAFDQEVRSLAQAGFSGINVTIPHKEAAAKLADSTSQAVGEIGAANTLTFKDGEILAENTDSTALITALGRTASAKKILVLGAGGTARAAVWALKDAGADVAIHNRTGEKASALAEEFGVEAVDTTAGGAGYAAIVNTTSVGMEPATDQAAALASLELDLSRIAPDATLIDFVYREGGSPLTLAARAHGLTVIDGPELLVLQGAASFELWFGRPAPLEAMRSAVS